MGRPYGTAIWILESSIKQASVELTLCLGCEGVIKGDVDNLRPLGNLHRRLRAGTVTSISNLAFVRGTSVQALIMTFSIHFCVITMKVL